MSRADKTDGGTPNIKTIRRWGTRTEVLGDISIGKRKQNKKNHKASKTRNKYNR